MSETASSLLHEGKENGNKPPEQKWYPTEKTPGQIESPGRRVRDMVSGANPDMHQAWYKEEDVYNALESVPSAQPEHMTNRQWIDFLSAQKGGKDEVKGKNKI